MSVFIALGSNLGDRIEYLERALIALHEYPGVRVTQVSRFYETDPVGGPGGQEPYINAAAELDTQLPAAELLAVLLQVEQQLGRVRREKHGPRTVDLDLLLYYDAIITAANLAVPHPLMQERRFVLEPLAEIAGAVQHPRLRESVAALLQKLPPSSEQVVRRSHPRAPWPYQGRRNEQRELAGMRALVTGSTSGIGLAIAKEFADGGADVALHGRRSRLAVELAAADCRGWGVHTQALRADVRSEADCARLVEQSWNAWNGIDVWVNNAGADTLTGEAARWSFERKLSELWAVDVQGTIRLSRLVGERMKAQGKGVIINIGWDQAEIGMAGDSGQLFAASKAAVMAFSKSLALSLAPAVRVNCIAPGWIRTAWGERASEYWQERAIRETPLARWGTPEDIARAARWLADPAAAFITGQTIRVNGGAVR